MPHTLNVECVHTESSVVTSKKCRFLSSKSEKNEVCQSVGCQSAWRACTECIKNGDSQKAKIVSPEIGLCPDHLDSASEEDTDTGGTDAESEIDKVLHYVNSASGSANGNTQSDKSEPTEKKRGRSKSDAQDKMDATISEIMENAKEPVEIPVGAIQRFDKQPRVYFTKQDLEELGNSLKGVQMIPIFVRELSQVEKKRAGKGIKYEIVDGERRWRAATLVGMETLRALILKIPDEKTQFAISAIANFGRKGHEPLEDARAIRYFVDEWDMPKRTIAEKFSRSEPWVYDRLRLLNLCDDVRALMNPSLPKDKRLSSTIARELSFHEDHAFQKKMLREITAKKMNSRKAVQFIRQEAESEGKAAKKNVGIESTGKCMQALVRFQNSLYSRIPYLLDAERFFKTLHTVADREERDTLRSNLMKAAKQIEVLAKKIK